MDLPFPGHAQLEWFRLLGRQVPAGCAVMAAFSRPHPPCGQTVGAR